MQIEDFWNMFLSTAQKDNNTKYIEAFHFERNEELANQLLKLVLDGKKRATASSLYDYELEAKAGSLQYSYWLEWGTAARN